MVSIVNSHAALTMVNSDRRKGIRRRIMLMRIDPFQRVCQEKKEKYFVGGNTPHEKERPFSEGNEEMSSLDF